MTSSALPSSETRERRRRESGLAKALRENALSIVLALAFVALLIGQAWVGFAVHNEELEKQGRPALAFTSYLRSSHFLEAVFENWESEFLQMGVFVLLAVRLRQKGSSESKPLSGETDSDEDPRRHRDDPRAPWPVRRGGIWLAVYQHSLSIALFTLFLVSLIGHAVGGLGEFNLERHEHGEAPASVLVYLTSSEFWFQSFQNWQSEFLAVLAMVVLSIFLRQRGSPQSKPVAAPHSRTG